NNLKRNENSTVSQIIFDSDTYTWINSLENWFNKESGFLNNSIQKKLSKDKTVYLDIYRNQQRVFLSLFLEIDYLSDITYFNEEVLIELNSNKILDNVLFSNYKNNLSQEYLDFFFSSLEQNTPYSSAKEFEEKFEKILNLTLLIENFDLNSNLKNFKKIVNYLNYTENLTIENHLLSNQRIVKIHKNLFCYEKLNLSLKNDLFKSLESNSPYLSLFKIENITNLLCEILNNKKEIIQISNSLNEDLNLNLNNFENLISYYESLQKSVTNSNFTLHFNSTIKNISKFEKLTYEVIDKISNLSLTYEEQLFKDIKLNQPYSSYEELLELINSISNYYLSLEDIVNKAKKGEFSVSKLNEIKNNYELLEFENIITQIHLPHNYNNSVDKKILEINIKIDKLNETIDIISEINKNLINFNELDLFNSYNELFEIVDELLQFKNEVINLISSSKKKQFNFKILEDFNSSLSNFENLFLYHKITDKFNISQTYVKNNELKNTIENKIQKDLYNNKKNYNYDYLKFEELLINLIEFRILEFKLKNLTTEVGQNETNISILTDITEILEMAIPKLENLENISLDFQTINKEYITDLKRKLGFLKLIIDKSKFLNDILSFENKNISNFDEIILNIWTNIELNINPILINDLNKELVFENFSIHIKGIKNDSYFSINHINQSKLDDFKIKYSSNIIDYYEIIGSINENLSAKISFEISNLNNFENFSILKYQPIYKEWVDCYQFGIQTYNSTHISCEILHFSYWGLSGNKIITEESNSNPSISSNKNTNEQNRGSNYEEISNNNLKYEKNYGNSNTNLDTLKNINNNELIEKDNKNKDKKPKNLSISNQTYTGTSLEFFKLNNSKKPYILSKPINDEIKFDFIKFETQNDNENNKRLKFFNNLLKNIWINLILLIFFLIGMFSILAIKIFPYNRKI
ncbi:MAG: hypothetical protein ACMXYB_05560, partial [Candidatus Woesearchaeota archaeon]